MYDQRKDVFYLFRIFVWISSLLFIVDDVHCDVENSSLENCVSRSYYEVQMHAMTKENERLLIENHQRGKELQELRNTLKSQKTVAFMTQLSYAIDNPATGLVLTYDTTPTNVGDSFKPGAGIFVAPDNGTYIFSLSAKCDSVELWIMQNEKQACSVNNDIRSITCVLQLSHLDLVFVKVATVTAPVDAAPADAHAVHSALFSGFQWPHVNLISPAAGY